MCCYLPVLFPSHPVPPRPVSCSLYRYPQNPMLYRVPHGIPYIFRCRSKGCRTMPDSVRYDCRRPIPFCPYLVSSRPVPSYTVLQSPSQHCPLITIPHTIYRTVYRTVYRTAYRTVYHTLPFRGLHDVGLVSTHAYSVLEVRPR